MNRRPNFFVDEKKKTPDWLKETALGVSDIMVGHQSKIKDLKCWDMYNEVDDEADFDYLTKIGENVLPARVRTIGIQRPKINFIARRESKRPSNFATLIVDNCSLKKKQEDIAKIVFNKLNIKAKERSFLLNVSLKKIGQQKQKIQEQLQQLQQQLQNPQIDPNQQEDPEYMQQVQQQQQMIQQQYEMLNEKLPEIEESFQMIEEGIKEESLFNNKELDDIKRYSRYTYKDIKEELSQKVMKDMVRQLGVKRKNNQNFISSLVTGKEYFFVDQLPGEPKPRYDVIPDVKVFFPADSKYRFTHQGRWVGIEEKMSYDAIKMEFCNEVGWNEEVEKALENADNNYSQEGGFLSTADNKAIDIYSGSSASLTNGINVRRIWWKSPRKVLFKISPNPYVKGKTFTHFIDKGKTIIDPADYKFVKGQGSDKGKYINKSNKEITYDADKVEKVFKGSDKVEERYIDDIYQAVILNREFVVGYKLKPIILRSIDNPSEAFLPIIGRTFSDITERPYSLIWATRHLQILYKIISFQKELLIALSGVKGMIIDLSQKPSNMSREEQYYHRKQGSLYIETVDKQGKPIRTSFNQWKDFDDTLSQSIQNIDPILNNIDLMCHRVMGINPQIMGQVEDDQLNGTMEMARDQAELVISSLFYDHDEIVSEAQNMLLNLACKFSFTRETLLNIIDDDMGVELVQIQNKILNEADYKFIMSDSLKEENQLKEIKQLAFKQADRGILSFDKMIDIYSIESLKELTKKVQYYNEVAQQMAQENAEMSEEKALEFEKAKISFAKEYDMAAAKEVNRLKEMELQLKQAELKLKEAEIQGRNELDKYRIDTEDSTKRMGIGAEREVEATYLQEQNRAATTQEQLQSIKLELDAMQLQLNGVLKQKEISSKHDIEIKKASIKKKERNTI
jgi:hypothetical protein